ncbi:MAG: arginase family protein [Bacteroidota bacterium]
MGHLNLCFPEWQGYAESNDVYHGALALRDALDIGDFHLIEVPETEELSTANQIKGYTANLRQLQATRRAIDEIRPDSVFMVGGTCSSEIAPVSWLNHRYGGDLTVLWFDAHGDLNTPETSPSKHFHGMPLRSLVGEGDRAMLQERFSNLTPKQIILVGTRDLDAEEERFINEQRIAVVRSDQLQALHGVVEGKGAKKLYVHVDLDVLDPESFSHQLLPVRGGPSTEILGTTLQHLSETFDIVGLSIVEYAPKDNTGLSFLKRIAKTIRP